MASNQYYCPNCGKIIWCKDLRFCKCASFESDPTRIICGRCKWMNFLEELIPTEKEIIKKQRKDKLLKIRKMKTKFITLMMAFILVSTIKMYSQTPDQLKSIEQMIGTWQGIINNDTTEIWNAKQYGKGVIIFSYYIVNGIKTAQYVNVIAVDNRKKMLRGFILYINGKHSTWTGKFSTEKALNYGIINNFDNNTCKIEVELSYETPIPIAMRKTDWKLDGEKISEQIYIKIK